MSFVPLVEKAKREKCKASIMIEGLPGSGKSGLALVLAEGLSNKSWEGVGAIDTENKSLKLFPGTNSSSGIPFGEFYVTYLTPDIGCKPTNYTAIRTYMKEKHEIEVCVKDSISHAWMYKGGVLDLLSKAKKKSAHYAKDNYAAWGDEEVVEEKNEILQLIRDPDIHVITTVRVKEKFEYETGDDGKNKLKSLGEQQIQQAELKYEPDLVLHMTQPGYVTKDQIIYPKARVNKTRYNPFTLGEEYEFKPSLIQDLKSYLEEGEDPEVITERHRQEYVAILTEHLKKNKTVIPIWKALKKDAGFEESKLEDLSLKVIKDLYLKLTS